MEELLNKARALGFSKAVFLNDFSVECRPELRAYCNPEQCHNHGQNWVCPPGCGTLEECREKARGFSEAILLQSITGLDPPAEPETYRALNREHNFRFREFIELVKPEAETVSPAAETIKPVAETIKPAAEKILPLTSGGCVFCELCSYPEPCVKPDVKMESLSAFGIDVGKLCAAAGLPYAFTPETVYFTALLLLKTAEKR